MITYILLFTFLINIVLLLLWYYILKCVTYTLTILVM